MGTFLLVDGRNLRVFRIYRQDFRADATTHAGKSDEGILYRK